MNNTTIMDTGFVTDSTTEVVYMVFNLNYLLKRMDRSFASIENLVTKINLSALESSRKITVPFVRELL